MSEPDLPPPPPPCGRHELVYLDQPLGSGVTTGDLVTGCDACAQEADRYVMCQRCRGVWCTPCVILSMIAHELLRS